MEHALREPLAVAEVDEDHAAVVAGGIDPTNQGDGLAGMGLAEFVAVMGAHGWKTERRVKRDFKTQEREVVVSLAWDGSGGGWI
jgi:hypothetical protein